MNAASSGTAHPEAGLRQGAMLRAVLEGLVLALVALSPWAFGAVHPLALLVLYAGLAGCLVLWAALLLRSSRRRWRLCPVALCLAGMVLLGVGQSAPLPRWLLEQVGPANFALRAELLPDDPEAVPAWTVSFSPHATRGQVVQLAAVLALFLLVRYELASVAALRRLAVVAVVNGALLSLFALAQFFSSPGHQVYWHFESQGTVFGPFICRNHFPFYVNVCLGLGAGLLLAAGLQRSCPQAWSRGRAERDGWLAGLVRLGRDPVTPWLAAALGLMLAANLYSQSRGGVLALGGAAVVCLLFWLCLAGGHRRAPRLSGGTALAVAVAVGLGLVGWFGSSRLERRLATVWSGDALEEGRGPLWARTFSLAARFPVWGTGFGTFEQVEPMTRTPADRTLYSFDHAHNEYLETLIEGGAVHLLLCAGAIGGVFWAAGRAYGRGGGGAAALILGGLFGFTTVALHSLADFGLHVPSIVLLTTVLAGHLVGLCDGQAKDAPAGPAGGRWLGVPAAGACLLLAVALPVEGWKVERADRLRLSARRADSRLAPGQRDVVIRYLAGAVPFQPNDPLLRLRLAEARHGEYHTRVEQRRACLLAGGVAGLSAPLAGGPAGTALRWGGFDRFALAGEEEADLARRYLRPALRDYQSARAGNPLLVEPHVRLAANRGSLAQSERPSCHLRRACRLAPSEANLWYLLGVYELREGQADQAWRCWRLSLERADTYLAPIVTAGLARLGAAGLADRVLPARAELLIAAASLPGAAEAPATRQMLLRRALRLVGERPEQANDRYRRAWLLREFGEREKAIQAYQAALERAPGRGEWRYELAELFHAAGRPDEARRELRRLLAEQPGHTRAQALFQTVVREQVER
jgi:tetratricopeptide (TPR) repeat protein/O-antigen ligase